MLVMCLNITCICGIKCAIELKFDDASDALLQVFSVFSPKNTVFSFALTDLLC